MKIRRSSERLSSLRIYGVTAVMLGTFLLLMVSLWRLQISKVSQFTARQKIQSVRRIRLPGIRGKIYDRNGLCLADNRPSYSIALFPEEIRGGGHFSDRAIEVMQNIAQITGLTPSLQRKNFEKHIDWYRPLPLVLWRDVGPKVMARFAEQGDAIPGVDLYVQATRNYPYSPYTSHLIGYVSEIDPDSSGEESYDFDLFEMTGKAGLEKLFDPFLQGKAGAKLVQVDVGIYHHGDLACRVPKRGGDLRLTLDMEVQLLAHQALSTNRGAVVVLDANNGDVLAMLSAPGYDANLFVPKLLSKDWKKILENPHHPLINRAVSGTYPPGSIFKPLVGLAASTLHSNSIYTEYESPATFRVGRRIIRTRGHGKVNLRQALEKSANVYFFKTALKNGWEPIVEQALAVGLGKKTGVEVDSEKSGLVPDLHWQRKEKKGGWTDGDTCNLSIGQGYLTVTPLQMAMMTATIANGGTLYTPRLVWAYRGPESEFYIDSPVRRAGKMHWSAEALNIVRSGMHDVVMSPKGTGRRAAVEGLTYAAKTGTAEYGIKSENKKHTWMIAFAPFNDAQYAIAFLIEDGVSGGYTVAPRMKVLMEGLFKKMKREGRVSQIQDPIINVQYSMLNVQYPIFNPQSPIPNPQFQTSTSPGGAS